MNAIERIGFSGTQHGMTEPQKAAVLQLISSARWLHHGDCVGSDKEVHDMAHQLGIKIIVHPPANPAKRAFCDGHTIHPVAGYISRNQDIVDAVQQLVAAPATMKEARRSGTWATVRYAKRLRRPTAIVFPDGRVQNA